MSRGCCDLSGQYLRQTNCSFIISTISSKDDGSLDGSNLRNPSSSLTEWLCHFFDHDGQKIQQLIVHTHGDVSFTCNIVSQVVGWIAPFLSIINEGPQTSFIQRVEATTKLHAHLDDPWGSFGGLVENAFVFETRGIVLVQDVVGPLAVKNLRFRLLKSLGDVASEV